MNQQGIVPIFHWMESEFNEDEDDWTQKFDLYLGNHLVSSRVSRWETDSYIEEAVKVLARLIGRELRG